MKKKDQIKVWVFEKENQVFKICIDSNMNQKKEENECFSPFNSTGQYGAKGRRPPRNRSILYPQLWTPYYVPLLGILIPSHNFLEESEEQILFNLVDSLSSDPKNREKLQIWQADFSKPGEQGRRSTGWNSCDFSRRVQIRFMENILLILRMWRLLQYLYYVIEL